MASSLGGERDKGKRQRKRLMKKAQMTNESVAM